MTLYESENYHRLNTSDLYNKLHPIAEEANELELRYEQMQQGCLKNEQSKHFRNALTERMIETLHD